MRVQGNTDGAIQPFFRTKKYTEAERQLAAIARKAAMNRDVLYHGTRHAQTILTTGVLFPGEEGGKVSFTRSAEEAAYWATIWSVAEFVERRFAPAWRNGRTDGTSAAARCRYSA
jgi:hypothetical protein